MALTDEHRRHLDVNGAYLALLGHPRDAIIGPPLWCFVSGGPRLTAAEWATMLAEGRASGDAELVRADGSGLGVQWAAAVETITGRQLVLVVALSTSRWGAHFRRTVASDATGARVTAREREVIRLVALGLTGREIGDQLHIAHDTVRTHVRNAMTKCWAHGRVRIWSPWRSAKALSKSDADARSRNCGIEGRTHASQPKRPCFVSSSSTTAPARAAPSAHRLSPPDDVRADLLTPSDTRSTSCEFKGVARYLDAIVAGRRVHAVGWTYRNPSPGYEALRDHIAFYPSRVDGAWIGEERVRAQRSDFYGGWITADLIGPSKDQLERSVGDPWPNALALASHEHRQRAE